MSNSVTNLNREFYNKRYVSKSVFISILHSFISFDQQSKSKRNFKHIKFILKKMKQKKVSFLDYGFGHGSLLLKMPRNIDVFGCEISEEAVSNLSRISKLIKRDFNVATTENFNNIFHGYKFDIINCSHVLEHVEDDVEIIEGFKNILNNQGKLIINLPINEVWKDPKHVREYNKEIASKLLTDSSFRIDGVFESDRLTGFILTYEQTKDTNFTLRFLLRCVRFFFGIMPQFFSDIMDKILPAKFKNQQLIIIATKNE